MTSDAMVVTIVTEGDPNRMSGGFLYHRRLADLAPEHGAEVRFVSVPQRRYPLAAADGPAVMRSARSNADVVVIDSLASNTLGPWVRRRGAPAVPLVGSVHQVLGGGDAGPVRRALQARSDRRVWAQCARLVVASELLAARLEADAIPREKMVVVVPGRDVTEPTGPVEPLGDLRQGRAAAVLCVANWQPRKGILELLDAVAALPADVATVHLVGDEAADPAYARRVRARLAERDVADRVVCHGIVAPASMGRWYEAADVFALASTEEPYGTVYGEAMIAGLPVVGWAAGNLVNLADDRVEGRVVALEDGAGLSAALREVCLDEALRARWGEAARRRAASLPTWQATAERFFAVCREAAASLAP